MFVPLPLAIIHSTANVSSDKEGGVTFTEVAGKSFTAKVGSFDFKNVDLAITATIDWGDGHTSAGTLEHPTLDNYNVIGMHTYAKTGAKPMPRTADAARATLVHVLVSTPLFDNSLVASYHTRR